MAIAPGIRFTEQAAPVAVAGATTVVGGFIGTASRGRTDKPQLVRNSTEYATLYGDILGSDTDLGMAIQQFNANGGTNAYILRVVGSGAVGASNTTGLVNHSGGAVAIKTYANSEGTWGDDLSIQLLTDERSIVGKPVAMVSPSGAFYITLGSVLGLKVGDVYDIFNATTNAVEGGGPLVILYIDASNKRVYFEDPGGAGAVSVNAVIRTCSQHLSSTQLADQMAIAATTAKVAASDGIQKGSMVTFGLYSQCATLATRDRLELESGYVTKVSGNNITFAALGNAAVIPAATNAFHRFIEAGVNGIDLEANTSGEGGNSISFEIASITYGAASEVIVSGNKISLYLTAVDAGAAGAITTSINLINNSADASVLVTASLFGASVAIGSVEAEVNLTGGASTRCITQEFQLEVITAGVSVETHQSLSMGLQHSRYVEKRLGGVVATLTPDRNTKSGLIILDDGALANTLLNMPQARAIGLAGGLDGNTPGDTAYIGTSSPKTGINLFDGLPGMRLFAAPAATSTNIQRALISFAEAHQKIYVVLDVPEAAVDYDTLASHRQFTLGVGSHYAALFGPWIVVSDPTGAVEDVRAVAPSPSIMGICTSVMSDGQHLSIGNQPIRGALDVLGRLNPAEFAALGAEGVNLIHDQNGGQILVGDDYVLSVSSIDPRSFGSVRRWLGYMKSSIDLALQPSLFSEATPELFDGIRRAIGNFLQKEYSRRALFGRTPNEAYQVLIGEETTSDADLAAGKVRGVIRISLTTPARNFEFKIATSAGGLSIS